MVSLRLVLAVVRASVFGLALSAASAVASDVDGTQAREGSTALDRSALRPYAVKVGRRHYVRIGAFDFEDEARVLASELRGLTSEPVDVAEFGMGRGRGGVGLYRVVIGPIKSKAEVPELVASLKRKGYGAPRAAAADTPDAEPATAPGLASSQPAVGPDLVEVGVEHDGDVAARPAAQRIGTIRPSVRQRQVADTATDQEALSADPDASGHSAAGGAARQVRPQQSPPSTSPQRRANAFIVIEAGRRFLQMGAFAVRSTADTLASQLRRVASEPVVVAELRRDDGGTLYRVRIGPITSDAALAALLEALRPDYSAGWELPPVPAT